MANAAFCVGDGYATGVLGSRKKGSMSAGRERWTPRRLARALQQAPELRVVMEGRMLLTDEERRKCAKGLGWRLEKRVPHYIPPRPYQPVYHDIYVDTNGPVMDPAAWLSDDDYGRLHWEHIMLLWADAAKRGGEFWKRFLWHLIRYHSDATIGWDHLPELLRILPKEPERVARAYLVALEVRGND